MLFVAAAVRADDAGLARSQSGGGLRPGMAGVVLNFFSDAEGVRQGRLCIERVSVEPKRDGFLQLAWRPQLVLEGVSVEILAEAAWPDIGRRIWEALDPSGRGGAQLRNVRLRLGESPGREILAASGRCRADGALELTPSAPGAAPAAGAAGLLFWLVGPRAGQWAAIPPPGSTPPPAGSPRPVSTQSHRP